MKKMFVPLLAVVVAGMGFLFSPSPIQADIDPQGCTATGGSIKLSVFRSDGVTHISGSDTVKDEETIKYKAELGAAPFPACAFEGGKWTITTPDNVEHDVTPEGGMPRIGGKGIASLESVLVEYKVSHADEVLDAGQKRIFTSTSYGGGLSHEQLDDDEDNGGPAFSVRKGTDVIHVPTVETVIHNNTHEAITNALAGSSVHDSVVVSGNAGVPAGSVTFNLYNSTDCTGESLSAETAVLSGGSSESNPVTAISPGLSYKVHYSGWSKVYTPADGVCEPLGVVNAKISIGPDGENEVNTPHVFTGHVDVDFGSGFVNAEDGTLINFSILSGPGSLSLPNCLTSGGSGSCAVSLISSVPGVTVVSASSDIAVSGVLIALITDVSKGNSGPATKTWIIKPKGTPSDARISIGPSGTNTVGSPHIFTVHVDINPQGAGFVSAPDGTVIDVIKLSGPGTITGSPCITSAGTGSCTVIDNSSLAGVDIVSASTTVAVLGEPLIRTTDGSQGNSGPAVKTWISKISFSAARSHGYWKNHRVELGNMLSLGPIDLGDVTVATAAQAVAVLSNASASDARNSLRAQLLGTILNLRNNSNPFAVDTDIRPTVEDAREFLATHLSPVTGRNPSRSFCLSLKDKLDIYNNSGE